MEHLSKISILDWMDFHQLYSSLWKFYHQNLECNLRQNSIRFYEYEVFGEIQRFSYQRTPCHHKNYDAYPNYWCHLRLMDYFLYLWNLISLEHLLVFNVDWFFSFFPVHFQSPILKFHYPHYPQMYIRFLLEFMCSF